MVNAGLTTFSKIEQTGPRELELVSQNILQNVFRSLEKHLFMMKSFCFYNSITDFFFFLPDCEPTPSIWEPD